jgi:hypothetical protein
LDLGGFDFSLCQFLGLLLGVVGMFSNSSGVRFLLLLTLGLEHVHGLNGGGEFLLKNPVLVLELCKVSLVLLDLIFELVDLGL